MGASPVTLSSALTTVRDFLDEPVAQMWSNAQLTNYLNLAQADVQRKSEALRQTSTVPINTNVQRYNAPPDTFRIYRVEYIPTNSQQTYGLEFRGFNEMDAIWGIYQQYSGTTPSIYTLWLQPPTLQIILYPVPAQAGVMNCYYYRQPVPMVENTDTMDCLPGWEDCLYDFAVYRALRQDADPRWQDQFQLYSDHLNDMIAMSRTFTDQPNFFSTGSSTYPDWLVSGGYGW